eukprot:1707528-Alexandrium_andersonii.AAC.1
MRNAASGRFDTARNCSEQGRALSFGHFLGQFWVKPESAPKEPESARNCSEQFRAAPKRPEAA